METPPCLHSRVGQPHVVGLGTVMGGKAALSTATAGESTAGTYLHLWKQILPPIITASTAHRSRLTKLALTAVVTLLQ